MTIKHTKHETAMIHEVMLMAYEEGIEYGRKQAQDIIDRQADGIRRAKDIIRKQAETIEALRTVDDLPEEDEAC